MLKKDSDKLKKLKKQQAALQQSMLNEAINNHSKNECIITQSNSVLSCPFMWGLASLLVLAVIII